VTCRRGEGRTPGRLTRLPGGARRRAGRFDERGDHGEVRPDPVVEPFEAGRWRPAGPPGRGPRSAPGPRGSDRPQAQRRLLPGRAAAGGGAVLPADAARACCSGTSSSRCMPCCFRVLLPRAAAARAHGRREGAAPLAGDARLGGVLHHLLLHSRAAPARRPGPVRGRHPGRDGPRFRLYVPRPEEPGDHLVFEEFAVVRLASTAGTGPRHCWRRGCAAPSVRGPSAERGCEGPGLAAYNKPCSTASSCGPAGRRNYPTSFDT
jgi:hypothetical protein